MIRLLKNVLIFAGIVSAIAMIPLDKGYATEIKSIDSVTTCDLSDNPKKVFNPGDDIRYKVSYTTEKITTFSLLGGIINGTTFREILSWQWGILSAGTHTSRWDSKIPSDASGHASVRIIYIGIIDDVAIAEATFTIEVESPDEADYVGSDVCMACHSEVSEPMKDSAHGFIECESCHGPGSIHASSPSPGNITVDIPSSLCGQCHTRGDDQNRIVVEGSLIKSNQQYDELLGGGKHFIQCVQCHNLHVSPTSDAQETITADCSTCHSQTINQIHSVAGVECTDCHMPYAVKKVTSTGYGDHLKGDSRTHIFTVNTTASSSEMFYQQSDKTYANGFLTLNFVCLGCHDGIEAREHDIEWARQAAGLIHSE
jgi:hypothetical protein